MGKPLKAMSKQQIPSAIRPQSMFSFLSSASFWTAFVTWAGLIVAGAAIWGLRLSNRESEAKDEEMVRLKKETADALAQGAKASLDAAAAMERAAIAQLEAEKIKERIAWREISDWERLQFLENAKMEKKGRVLIIGLNSSPEADNFARQVATLFSEAGFDTESTSTIASVPFVGITFGYDLNFPPLHLESVRRLADILGMRGAGQHHPENGNSITIMIGAKQ